MNSFAFPLNLALWLLLALLTFVAQRLWPQQKHVRLLASKQAALVLLALFGVGCLLIAFFPEASLQRSWCMVALLVGILVHLQLIVHRYRGAHRWRFRLNHFGLYLFIGALLFGSPDAATRRLVAYEGRTTHEAYDAAGRRHPLGYQLRLDTFLTTYYAAQPAVPQSFQATLKVSENGKPPTTRTILVNHPWRLNLAETLYLVSHGSDPFLGPYAVIESVRQPWQHLALLGIHLTAAGAVLLCYGKHRTTTHRETKPL